MNSNALSIHASNARQWAIRTDIYECVVQRKTSPVTVSVRHLKAKPHLRFPEGIVGVRVVMNKDSKCRVVVNQYVKFWLTTRILNPKYVYDNNILIFTTRNVYILPQFFMNWIIFTHLVMYFWNTNNIPVVTKLRYLCLELPKCGRMDSDTLDCILHDKLSSFNSYECM